MRFRRTIFLIVIAVGLAGCQNPKLSPATHYAPTAMEHAAWPKTVDEAVGRLLGDLNEVDKARVRATRKEDLILFHHGWGTGIRNEFGLWRGNTNLMADCHADHPDGASMVII